jgi:hypothetical protein
MGRADADYLPFRIRFSIGAAATAAATACVVAAIAIDLYSLVAAISALFRSGLPDEPPLNLALSFVGFLVGLFFLPIFAIAFGAIGTFTCLAPCFAIAHLKPTQLSFVIAGIVAGLIHATAGLALVWLFPTALASLPTFPLLFSGLMAYGLGESVTLSSVTAVTALVAGVFAGLVYWKIITFAAR